MNPLSLRSQIQWHRIAPAFIVISLLGSAPVVAQEAGENHDPSGHHSSEHRHHLGLFLGGTNSELSHTDGAESHSSEQTLETGRENVATLGIDYQYRLNRFLGAGAIYDHAFGDFRTTVAAPGLFIRPVEQVQILAAPGVEVHEGEKEFVFRLGFYYEFHVERLSVAPTLAADFLEGKQTLIYGLTLGFGF